MGCHGRHGWRIGRGIRDMEIASIHERRAMRDIVVYREWGAFELKLRRFCQPGCPFPTTSGLCRPLRRHYLSGMNGFPSATRFTSFPMPPWANSIRQPAGGATLNYSGGLGFRRVRSCSRSSSISWVRAINLSGSCSFAANSASSITVHVCVADHPDFLVPHNSITGSLRYWGKGRLPRSGPTRTTLLACCR